MKPSTVLAVILVAAQLFAFPLAGYSGEETQALANDQKPADASQMATKKFSPQGTVSALSQVAEKEQQKDERIDGRIVVNEIPDLTMTDFLQERESPLKPATFNLLVRPEGKDGRPLPRLEDVLNGNPKKEDAASQNNPAEAEKGTGKGIEDKEATVAPRTGEPLTPMVAVENKPTPGVDAVMVMNAKVTPEKKPKEDDTPLNLEESANKNDVVTNGIVEVAPKAADGPTIPIQLVPQSPKPEPMAPYYSLPKERQVSKTRAADKRKRSQPTFAYRNTPSASIHVDRRRVKS